MKTSNNSETRVHTVQSQLAGDAPRRQGDEAAGAGVEEMSTGSAAVFDSPGCVVRLVRSRPASHQRVSGPLRPAVTMDSRSS
jgi:hypothetical protein